MPRSANGCRYPHRGTKMSATERPGLGFLPANAGEPASAWYRQAKTKAAPRAFRPDLMGRNRRINSCNKPSRVETTTARRACFHIRSSAHHRYHYCSINPERRNSENCCRYCGNLATWICVDFPIPLKNKHLDFFQNGPRLAKSVAPAQVHLYWCPGSWRS